MTARRLTNYLRTYRKRRGLSQREAALHLGYWSASVVSRCECGRRPVTLRAAIAFSVMYGASIQELFAGMYAEVEDAVRKRQGKQLVELSDALTPPAVTKL